MIQNVRCIDSSGRRRDFWKQSLKCGLEEFFTSSPAVLASAEGLNPLEIRSAEHRDCDAGVLFRSESLRERQDPSLHLVLENVYGVYLSRRQFGGPISR